MSGQMTHDLAVTAHENLAGVHAMLFPKPTSEAASSVTLAKSRRA